MKKQMLTLAMCLALTTASVWASSMSNVVPNIVTQNTQKTGEITLISNQIPVSDVTPAPTQSVKTSFRTKWDEDREELYCKLGLTPEQRTKAKALDEKKKSDAQPLIAKFHEEKVKLHQLKAAKACSAEIDQQKIKVKAAERAIKAHMHASRKKFEAILDECQLAKYKEIRAERKKQWEKYRHHHGACGTN